MLDIIRLFESRKMVANKNIVARSAATPRIAAGRNSKSGQFLPKGSKAIGSVTKSQVSPASKNRKMIEEHGGASVTGTGLRAITSLKPAGGSLVMTVPAAIRRALGYETGTELSVTVDGGKMVIEAVERAPTPRRIRRPAYTLDDLLAQSDFAGTRSAEEEEWINAGPVGREIW